MQTYGYDSNGTLSLLPSKYAAGWRNLSDTSWIKKAVTQWSNITRGSNASNMSKVGCVSRRPEE